MVGSRLQNYLEGKEKAGQQVTKVPVGSCLSSGCRGGKPTRDKVEAGNEIAIITFRLCSEAHKKRRSFAIENPRGSFMWGPARCTQVGSGGGCVQGDLLTLYVRRRLEEQACHCAHQLAGSCKNGKTCDRTGVAHETLAPTVVSGEILNYPTEADEE